MSRFRFGATSKRRLHTCASDIQHAIIFALHLSDVDFFVAEGKRDQETQEKYFTTGASKVHYPDSFHNEEPLSLAVDVVPWVNGKAVWSCDTPKEKAAWREVVRAIKTASKKMDVSLEWGFDLWKWDRPHWQLTSYRNK